MQCYRICSYCKQEKDTMLRCGACRGAFYCDKTCQAAAWPGHKTRCAQKTAIALFARKHLEKQPTTFKLLALCANIYCRLYQGNAIQVAMDKGNTVCFLLAGDSVTKIDLETSRICLFLGYRGQTVTLQYNKVEEPTFTARLEAEARHTPRMIIRVDYQAKLCQVTCGKVTLGCDI